MLMLLLVIDALGRGS